MKQYFQVQEANVVPGKVFKVGHTYHECANWLTYDFPKDYMRTVHVTIQEYWTNGNIPKDPAE